MNRYIPPIILMPFLMFISSCFCPLTSVHPLSDPQNAKYDDRIQGAWQFASQDGELVFLHFGKEKDNKTQMISIEHKNNGEMELSTFSVFPTITNGQNYLNFNIQELFKEFNEDVSGYIFMKYELLDAATLDLSYINEEPIIKAIKSGKLKGEITYEKTATLEGDEEKTLKQNRERTIECVKITDSPDNIIAYFQSVDPKKLFPKPMRLIRIKN